MPLIKLNNIDMYYEQHGSGPSLILIAGFTATNDVWKPCLEKLSKHYCVTIMDNRGVGKTSQQNIEYSIELMAEDVVQLCQYLGIKKANIVGHSMGGLILQILATKYSHYIKKAIFLCSSLLQQSAYNFHLEVLNQIKNNKIKNNAFLKLFACFLFGSSFLYTKNYLDAYIKAVQKNPYPQTIEGYDGQLNALKNFNRLEKLNKINIPSQAIYAEEDIITTKKTERLLKEHNENISIKWLKNCGHIPQLECPHLLTEYIINYFK